MGQNTTGDNQDLIDFFANYATDPTFAASMNNYAMSQQPVHEPVLGGMGTTTNEEYIAAKMAQDAAQKAEQDWYRSVRGTPDSPFYGKVGSEIDGQKIGWWYDTDGQMRKDFMPEFYAYDPEYEVMRQSLTDPTNRMENQDYGGLTLGGAPPPNGTGPGATFGKPPDFNKPAITTNPAIPPSRGTDPLQPYIPPTSGGTPGPAVWGGGQSGGGLQMGGGGVTGVAPVDWGAIDASLRPPLTGFEASTNKDLYQKQFQDLRTQENGQQLRTFAAALRAQEAENAPPPAPQDPWSWANLPPVQTGGTVAATPIEWGLNSNYGITPNMTNQQAVSAMSGVLSAEEMAMMARNFRDNPQNASANNWVNAGSPGALTGQIRGGTSPEFTSVLQKVFNNIYTQTGGGTGGIAVPPGYANPVNGQV